MEVDKLFPRGVSRLISLQICAQEHDLPVIGERCSPYIGTIVQPWSLIQLSVVDYRSAWRPKGPDALLFCSSSRSLGRLTDNCTVS
jgi:hypothetical protein